MHLDLVDFHTITLPDQREFIYVNIPRNSSQAFLRCTDKLVKEGTIKNRRSYCYIYEIDKINDHISRVPKIGFLKDPYIRFESIKRAVNSMIVSTNRNLNESAHIPLVDFEDILENTNPYVHDPHTSQQYDQFRYFGDITLFTLNKDLRTTLKEYFGVDLFINFDPSLEYISTDIDSYSFSKDPRFLERYWEDIKIWDRFKYNKVNILRSDFFNQLL